MCANYYLIFVRSGLFLCVLRCLCVFHALPGRCGGHQRAHRHQCGVVWLCAPSVPNGSTVGTNQISISPALSHHLSTRIWSSATFDSSKFDTLTIRQSRVLSQHRYEYFATAIAASRVVESCVLQCSKDYRFNQPEQPHNFVLC